MNLYCSTHVQKRKKRLIYLYPSQEDYHKMVTAKLRPSKPEVVIDSLITTKTFPQKDIK